jgi:fructosamine-3-kinase
MDERTFQRIKTSLEMAGESCRNLACMPIQRSVSASAYRVETTKQKYFVKIAVPGHEEMIRCEYKGLKKLESSRCVRTPVIYSYQEGEGTSPPFLLLEWIENHAGGNTAGQTKLGEQLATLHDASAAIFKVNQFGFEEDNYIGGNKQVNCWMPDWPTFFVECRLIPQIELGVRKKLIQKVFQDQLMRLCQRIPEFLESDPITPALLHGDLWGGNVLFTKLNEPILIDPAVYFGVPEAEIAFTELFGGFTTDFYTAYNSILPIPYGYKEKKNLYNLYHILNHLNLFGLIYFGQAKSCCAFYVE